MEDKISTIVFKYGDEEIAVQKGKIVLLKAEYENQNEPIILRTKEDPIHVKMFIDFVNNGSVPDDFKDQMSILKLFKEWECNQCVIEDFVNGILVKPMDGVIYHHQNEYPVHLGCFYSQSLAFQNNPDKRISIEQSYSQKAVETFISHIHYQICDSDPEFINEIIEISIFFGCWSLCSKLKDLLFISLSSSNIQQSFIMLKNLFLTNRSVFNLLKPSSFEKNIFIAAATGMISSIIYLIASGTKVSEIYLLEKYDYWLMEGATPLHFAARYGKFEVVDFLIMNGAGVNLEDKWV